jgi:hypothetical protein
MNNCISNIQLHNYIIIKLEYTTQEATYNYSNWVVNAIQEVLCSSYI